MENDSYKNALNSLDALRSKTLSVRAEMDTQAANSAAFMEALAQKEAEAAIKMAETVTGVKIDGLEKVSGASSKASGKFLQEWRSAFNSASKLMKDFSRSAEEMGGFGGQNSPLGGLIGGVLGAIFKKNFGGMFGGAFADGGRPPVDRVSLVGERGPELFVPDTAGTIVPNDALGEGLGAQAPVVMQNFTFQSLDPVTNMKMLEAQKNQIQSWVVEGIKANQNGLRSSIKAV